MAVSVAEYPVATLTSNDSAIAVFGGDLWFTGQRTNTSTGASTPVIGMLNPTTGASAQYDVPSGTAFDLGGLTAGKDGNLWFTVPATGAIGVFSPTTHASAEAPTPTPGSDPVAITTGLDGTLWFTEQAVGKIGSYDPATASFHEYPLANANSRPTGIAVAPDGTVWFTETASGVDKIGEVDPTTGQVTEYATSGAVSYGLAPGPDGQIWFGEGNSIAEVDTATGVITAYPASDGNAGDPQFASGAFGIAPDGDVLFATYEGSGLAVSPFLGEIDVTTHAVTYTRLPQTANLDPFSPAALTQAPVGGASYYVGQGPSGGVIGAVTPVPAGQSSVNGVVDQANSNIPLAGRTVYVDLNNDGNFDAGDPSAVTNAVGYYVINGVAPGAYPVRVTLLPGDFVVDASGQPTSAQTVGFTSGGATVADNIFIQATSSILPLTHLANPFGTGNPDVSTAEVTGLYNIILGRAPDAPGLAGWVGALKDGSLTLTQEATFFLDSTEYESRAITSYYEDFLGRTPAPSEVAGWVDYMQAGHSEEQVAQLFLAGAPYSALHPTNADFIESIYGNVLGRAASALEVLGWENYLNSGGTRAFLVQSAISASDTLAVQGFDAIFLGWPPYPEGDAIYVSGLQNGLTLADVAADFASSFAYIQRANATVS
jgi:streptogramin lyase